MAKVKYHHLSDDEKKVYLGDFYTMVSLLKTREEVKNFFKDLLTLSEMVMISRRIQIAKMLLEGETYESIRDKLKVGATTVSQVERWLNNGFGGYKTTIKKYKNKYPKFKQSEVDDVSPFSLATIRKKYPLHFLLLNLLDKK